MAKRLLVEVIAAGIYGVGGMVLIGAKFPIKGEMPKGWASRCRVLGEVDDDGDLIVGEAERDALDAAIRGVAGVKVEGDQTGGAYLGENIGDSIDQQEGADAITGSADPSGALHDGTSQGNTDTGDGAGKPRDGFVFSRADGTAGTAEDLKDMPLETMKELAAAAELRIDGRLGADRFREELAAALFGAEG